ncbi:hypothetical protein Taro_028411 [Colocasia esculenta]|uniref:Uncharacterized protein n=1 Tax=Colocasia esculenta TaxID=4460 RepID=A0A843VRS7_COLES|nr:hypothetical protein [Colocasia esculenta]
MHGEGHVCVSEKVKGATWGPEEMDKQRERERGGGASSNGGWRGSAAWNGRRKKRREMLPLFPEVCRGRRGRCAPPP